MPCRRPRPIRSVLIANRGEIALRIMRTCARLGLRTIAVYSDADADAMHVKAADEAIRIGPPPARASYLDIDAIVAAAMRAGASAVHPGYGFLSENAAFVRACEAAGLVFVGPRAATVEHMASKIEAKRIAENAGVPIVPGYHGGGQDDGTLAAAAGRVGYPVMIKAAAGGGGRGMRRVDRPGDFTAALAAARAEAEAAFGDGSMLLEKYVLDPRHIEVQLAGDRVGNLVHLFERDCSVQRSNQKLIEEAPAPNLREEVRASLFAAALKLGRAIGYDSVGTVEFIMDGDTACFLEMNTRLQVEHGVTESITGVDLVEWQILAAAGEELPLTQDRICAHGHAIEARLTAERADRAFQPVTGELLAVGAPRGARFDSGVAAGSKVGPYYDSMLAKVIAHGSDRTAALARLDAGLRELTLLGVPTNQAFLRDAVRHSLFTTAHTTTRFIDTAFAGGWKPDADEIRRLRAAACVAWVGIDDGEPADHWINPWHRRSAMRVTSAARPAKALLHVSDEYGESDAEVLVSRDHVAVALDGVLLDMTGTVIAPGLVTPDPTSARPFVAIRRTAGVSVSHEGFALNATICLRVEQSRTPGGHERAGTVIEAPLHGVVSQLHVTLGDVVKKGAPAVQMEAMKLVHTLQTPVAGRVAQVLCRAGDTVPAGAILIEISPGEVEEGA